MEAIQLLGLDTPWTMAERGDLEDMQMAAAVDHTLDFDRPDLAQGWTPVMYASSQDHPAVVAWLRASRGVDMHREGRDGLTCVFLAATGGSVGVLKLLIKYDCDEVDCHDMSPTEALCHGDQGAASLHGACLECACLLVLGGATVSAGYVSADARPVMMGWALAERASDYAPILVALGAKHGLGPDGRACVLGCLDGRAL